MTQAPLDGVLASSRSELKAAEAVAKAYRLADEQLRTAIEEIAIPALRQCEDEGCPEATPARAGLEEAIPDPVDEAQVREASWSDDGWH